MLCPDSDILSVVEAAGHDECSQGSANRKLQGFLANFRNPAGIGD
jgi:hypothetical protein